MNRGTRKGVRPKRLSPSIKKQRRSSSGHIGLIPSVSDTDSQVHSLQAAPVPETVLEDGDADGDSSRDLLEATFHGSSTQMTISRARKRVRSRSPVSAIRKRRKLPRGHVDLVPSESDTTHQDTRVHLLELGKSTTQGGYHVSDAAPSPEIALEEGDADGDRSRDPPTNAINYH
ncbi:uncharacterized protein LAESUDRAFT_765514 [Laetiporus sulphureus 93-53]|uniref:Uncharacterized protein n=1 Tax=Laetiporus sulphureus 93-53 TaxID=1314785 RepID=A0A165AQL0_9APHY|nr:uncharacterized protein LAESUDRAFT_765514 [Laetiporus sulphureus 93-53]KZS99458.1 hypothetical protein LAESUDRAFT_765514 [Laetiporus sulphureus 93-53]